MKLSTMLLFATLLVTLPIGPTFCHSAIADSSPTSSMTIKLDQKAGSVEFHATGHPSAIKIVGKGAGAAGTFTVSGTQVSGTSTFDLTTLTTGIEMRDKHMKEKYLEVEKYGQAKLTLTQLSLPKPLSGDITLDSIPYRGTLSLHGVEHAVSGTAKVVRAGAQLTLHAQFAIKIADYGISIPTFAGITMADDVQVDVEGAGNLNSGAPTSSP